jgi:hypothetical protein
MTTYWVLRRPRILERTVRIGVATEVEGTPLGERISAEAYDALRQRARELFRHHAADNGSVAIPLAGRLVVARR